MYVLLFFSSFWMRIRVRGREKTILVYSLINSENFLFRAPICTIIDAIIIIHIYSLPQWAQKFFISIVKKIHSVSEINCQIKNKKIFKKSTIRGLYFISHVLVSRSPLVFDYTLSVFIFRPDKHVNVRDG